MPCWIWHHGCPRELETPPALPLGGVERKVLFRAVHNIGKKRMKRKTVLLCSTLGLGSTGPLTLFRRACACLWRMVSAEGYSLVIDAMDLKIKGTRG